MFPCRTLKILAWLFAACFATESPAQVFINEVLVSPPNSATSTTNVNSLYNVTESPADNQEWIELYNAHPCDAADISCFTLGCNMEPPPGYSYSNWGAFTFPQGTIIPPLGFIIIGGNHAQVPQLDFDIGYYRNTSFGSANLCGWSDRWFLRDEFGWVALYDQTGIPVDAVFWDLYGDPGNLTLQSEYASPVIANTTCSGTQSLPAARNIANIEYAGQTISNSFLSFQRITDGQANWYSTPVTPTPRACNGICVAPPIVTCTLTDAQCDGNNGSITVSITDGGTGPYTINWIQPAAGNQATLTGLNAGTYIVQVSDAYNCFIVYDTVTLAHHPNPVISVDSLIHEMCSESGAAIYTAASMGTPPFQYQWNSSPPQTTAHLLNVHAGTYTVTITDALGCTASVSAVILNTPPPSLNFSDIHHDMCHLQDGSATLNISGGSPPYGFVWVEFPAITDSVLTNLAAGIYHVQVSDMYCSITAAVEIELIPGPQAAFSAYPWVSTIESPTIAFINESDGGTQYHWNFGDWQYSLEENPHHTYGDTGTYTVTLMIFDDIGCMDSVSHTVLILDRITLFVPNAFSPNGNSVNDVFKAYGQNIADFEMHIYNRWGEPVFHCNDINEGWDGIYNAGRAPDGVYSWLIYYRDDYRLYTGKRRKLMGHVTLLK